MDLHFRLSTLRFACCYIQLESDVTRSELIDAHWGSTGVIFMHDVIMILRLSVVEIHGTFKYWISECCFDLVRMKTRRKDDAGIR